MTQETNQTQKPDFMQSAMQFMQAGQSMMQQFFGALGKVGNLAQSIQKPADEAQAFGALQQEYAQKQLELWQSIMQKQQGKEVSFAVVPPKGDNRFKDEAWHKNPFYDYLHQAYLLNVEMLNRVVDSIPTKDEAARQKIHFLASQICDAFSPSNFAATNPEFIEKAMETNGQSITDGINNLLNDMKKGRISMTDESAFEIGKNLATTEGSVIYQNEVMQLIQYKPLTEKVGSRPMLVIPPSINKYYIMDLGPDNSLIRYMLEQGNNVFLISWVNPTDPQCKLTFDNFIENGIIKAVHIVQEVTGSKDMNMHGFCVGGAMTCIALAVMKARGENPAASLTLLTTMLDYSDTGDIGLLIDSAFLASLDAKVGKGGLHEAKTLQSTFSFLKPNELVWNYVVSNYLKGQKPTAFDILYWNSDSTNMSGPFACWYIRNLYFNNSLRVPGKLTVCGERVDLGRIDCPAYIFAAQTDHIVKWTAAYQSTRLLGGKMRFVLGASGHVAGTINPAKKDKRSYWTNDNLKEDADSWLSSATENKGSWWKDWAAWNKEFLGKEVPAPKTYGNAQYRVIEAAPGSYVKVRAV